SVSRIDGTLRLWDECTGKELHRITASDAPFVSVAFSPDGTIFAASQTNYQGIRIWDARTGQEGPAFENPQYWFGKVIVSPDSKIIAAAGARHRIALWDAATGRLVRRLHGNEDCGFPPPIAFSPDGRLLVSGRINRIVQLWDAATGAEVHRIQVPPGTA